jgi:hypothetical protein
MRTLLDHAPMEPGMHARQWLGEDDRGRRTASGVYFYLLETAGDRHVRRLVKLE